MLENLKPRCALARIPFFEAVEHEHRRVRSSGQKLAYVFRLHPLYVFAGGNAGIDAGAASEAGNDAGAGPAGAASDTQTLSGDEHELFQVETNVNCS